MSKKLAKAIIELINPSDNKEGQRFYGNFVASFRKIPTNKIPTMGVSITDGVNLYYNPEFIEANNVEFLKEVVIHECRHIMNLHPFRFNELGVEDKEMRTYNIATDATINYDLKALHDMGVTVDRLKKEIKEDVLDHQLSEYYFYKIKREQKRREENGEGEGQFGDSIDDHSMWSESSEISEETAKQIVKRGMEDAIEKSGGAGNVPQEVQESLNSLRKSSVNWKSLLRRFVARTKRYSKEGTRKRRNRRYGIMQPGKRKKPQVTLAIGIDTSGSVANAELEQFFGEIERIHKEGIAVKIIEADCRVNAVYDYNPKKSIEIHGRGGTEYSPAIEKAMELEVDGMIYFGDGDIFGETVTKPKFPMLWAMVRGNKAPVNWVFTCNVEVNE